MLGSMMRGAQDNEPVRIVIATLGAKLDVVQIQKDSLATTRNDAPSSIAPHDETAHGRWHVLPSAAWSDAHVGRRLVLASVDDAHRFALQTTLRVACPSDGKPSSASATRSRSLIERRL
jgi:hypothetical protein